MVTQSIILWHENIVFFGNNTLKNNSKKTETAYIVAYLLPDLIYYYFSFLKTKIVEMHHHKN